MPRPAPRQSPARAGTAPRADWPAGAARGAPRARSPLRQAWASWPRASRVEPGGAAQMAFHPAQGGVEFVILFAQARDQVAGMADGGAVAPERRRQLQLAHVE